MKTILVTGGAGFIGSHLVPMLLGLGYKVRVLDSLSPQIHGHVPSGLAWLDSGKVEFIRGSVTDRTLVEKALEEVQAIIHLAAETGTGQSMYDIANYTQVNVQGTAVLMDVLANTKNHAVKKIVLASSRSIYGEGAFACQSCSPDKRVYPESRALEQLQQHQWEYSCDSCGAELQAIATKESDPSKPASIYASSKFTQEELIRIACTSLGIGYTILRLQNVYGEGQSLKNPYTGILSIFSTKIRLGLELPIFEDGLESRDFVHVDDVAKAFSAAVELDGNDVINVGSGVKTSVLEVAQGLNQAFKGQSPLKVTKQFRLGDIRHNFADIQRLGECLHLKKLISLEEGLARFSQWVLTQPTPNDLLDAANKELRDRKLMG
ncbi:NAD-dependent epimerase/dehydratase family protein [Simiduia sp. 21SJ11W-1]|uniref:NAD-dependent epimerase/dehydratase family protein n=1 Tax=Simiduia sp. 21SJ11W-1 TaxID=2909669 RepID=UPI00209D90DA|nr:NAD-dependent epimerase/dehydratase family protein [Simiduia sp. 21SJ11W-1]UTA49541.1 NAD-dependent epimerase/dehydratase family protein [Simiduia sp. 21SJ11W-1]